VCSVPVVSLKTTMEDSGYDVRNISDERTHFVVVWWKNLFVSFVRDKHSFVFSLYLCIGFFLNTLNILFALYVNYLPLQIRNTFEHNQVI
jgi:hypothetical protein